MAGLRRNLHNQIDSPKVRRRPRPDAQAARRYLHRSLMSCHVTILVAVVLSDRVLLAADGSSIVTDNTHSDTPTVAERTSKIVGLANAKLMSGTVGAASNTVDFRDALSTHRFTTWRDVLDIGREELVSMNEAAIERAKRAAMSSPNWPISRFALIAGIVEGKPGAVKLVNNGTARFYGPGSSFVVGLHGPLVSAMMRFAELVAGKGVVDSIDSLKQLIVNVQTVLPDFVLPIDAWEVSA